MDVLNLEMSELDDGLREDPNAAPSLESTERMNEQAGACIVCFTPITDLSLN